MTKTVQEAVCKYLTQLRHKAICENFDYNWEMDVASLLPSGLIQEYEVKISRSDFHADKKRKATKFFHYQQKNPSTAPNYFNYVCPEGLIKESEIPEYSGLYYFKNGEIYCVKKAKRIHSKPVARIERVLRKMLRLNVQRKYLGYSWMTFKIKEADKLLNQPT